MSNATAAYYEYLALQDREKVAVMRRFGYNASADYVEARALRREAQARREAKRKGADGAAPLVLAENPDDDLAHMPSASG